jgi:hypothetical protein
VVVVAAVAAVVLLIEFDLFATDILKQKIPGASTE